jgi:hypothetical protein
MFNVQVGRSASVDTIYIRRVAAEQQRVGLSPRQNLRRGPYFKAYVRTQGVRLCLQQTEIDFDGGRNGHGRAIFYAGAELPLSYGFYGFLIEAEP